MSTLELDNNQAFWQIRSVIPGAIQINDKILTTSCLLTSTQLIEDWPFASAEALTPEAFTPMMPWSIAILLIGTGQTLKWVAESVYGHLVNSGVGVEIMHTKAASITFNILTAESRRVAAALIID